MTDWLGNVIDLFPDNPFTFGIDFILEAVGWLAEQVGNVLPGLAAMNPTGRLITELRESSGPEGRLSALVANYEPDANILLRMADVGVDLFFSGANDLVVPTEGGWRLEDRATSNISGEHIGCFGPGGNLGADLNGRVHHCNLFSRPESIDFLVQALRNEAHRIPPIDPMTDLPAVRLGRKRAIEALSLEPPRQLPAIGETQIVPENVVIPASPTGGYYLDEILNLYVLVPDVSLQETSDAQAPGMELRGTDDFNPVEFAHRIAASTKETTALMIASFRNARVSVPFRTMGGSAGRRFDKLIKTHQRIQGYVNGDPKPQFRNLPSDPELRNFGALLFSTLFPGEVRRLYDAARSELRRDRHLDVCLTSTIGWVADMPWEFAFDPSRQMYLCMEEVNFLRNIATAVPADSIGARSRPLRILVVAAQPIGAGTLSIAEEEDVIRRGFAALERTGLAEVTVVSNVTPGKLHEILSQADVRQQQYDILHFIGHGEFDDTTGFGFLLFEDVNGRSYRLRADYFRQIVARRNIRLVFLNACETGRGFKNGARFDFAQGAAPMLVAGGVPAVIANQFKVLDPSAMAFAQHFYWALAIGRTIGDAAREARVAVNYSIAGDAIDWAVPILFARNPSDRITQPSGDVHPQCPVPTDKATKATQRRSINSGRKRVAIWDVNYAIPKIDGITKRLNELQNYFSFEAIEMPAPIGTWRSVQQGSQDAGFVSAIDAAEKLEDVRKRLNAHQLFCITTLPLSLTGANDQLTLYVPDQTQVCIMSIWKTIDRFDPPLLTVERMIANHLAFSLSNLEYPHEDGSKDCPGYYNEEDDVQFLAGPLTFCRDCLEKLAKAGKAHRDALIRLTKAYPLLP